MVVDSEACECWEQMPPSGVHHRECEGGGVRLRGMSVAVRGVVGGVAGGAGTAGLGKELAVGWGKRATASFWRLALRYSAAAASSAAGMWAL